MSADKYNLAFILALLGKKENITNFIENQHLIKYPNFSFLNKKEQILLKNNLFNVVNKIEELFTKQEKLAKLKQELMELETEYTNFIKDNTQIIDLKNNKNLVSSKYLKMLKELEKPRISWLFKIKFFIMFGFSVNNLDHQKLNEIITSLQLRYYMQKQRELTQEINKITKLLTQKNELIKQLSTLSMDFFKDFLALKYKDIDKSILFKDYDLKNQAFKFLQRFPVVLSSSFSSLNSLNVIYDYVIMDEASQDSIHTACLALSCAKNAVIVGDSKQLPNVIDDDFKIVAEKIYHQFKVQDIYHYNKSFLDSISLIIPKEAQTILKEHYRCHPKIINFCNQKFYNNQLIAMTNDDKKTPLYIIKTVKGNHFKKDEGNQRQVDEVKKIMLEYNLDPKETAIISPYNVQVNLFLKNGISKDIINCTVHKSQGKEKDNVIFVTTDNIITDFIDNPNFLNVAISRAKKQFFLIISGNDQPLKTNITDLINYVEYNKGEIIQSDICSIFDYLYKQYDEERFNYLNNYQSNSKYSSEKIMDKKLKEILKEDKYKQLNVIPEYKVKALIKNDYLLNEKQLKYLKNERTRIDFLIYRKIDKKPILAIEVDGYHFHKANSKQYERDQLKNEILKLYNIPLIRFKTNGSEEERVIRQKLDELI